MQKLLKKVYPHRSRRTTKKRPGIYKMLRNILTEKHYCLAFSSSITARQSVLLYFLANCLGMETKMYFGEEVFIKENHIL